MIMNHKFTLVFFLSAFTTSVYSSGYPEKMSSRPLTLTKGLWEVDLSAYFRNPGNNNYFLNSDFNPRYGLTDNIELSLLGIKYNTSKPDQKYQLAFRFEVPTFGYSKSSSSNGNDNVTTMDSSSNFIYVIEMGVTGKYPIGSNSAAVADVSGTYSHGTFDDAYEFNPNVTYLYSSSDSLSFSAFVGINKSTFFKSTKVVTYITTYYNYSINFDVYSSMGYRAIGSLNNTKYHQADESILFSFGVLWRI